LGAFVQEPPTPLALLTAPGKHEGFLILYSLADHEIVAVSKPFTF
jgi:hypothetical protein